MFSGNLEDCSCVLSFHVSICLGLYLFSALSSLYKQCQKPYISPRAGNSFSKTNFHQWWGHDNLTLFSSCGVQMDGSSGLTTLSSQTSTSPKCLGPYAASQAGIKWELKHLILRIQRRFIPSLSTCLDQSPPTQKSLFLTSSATVEPDGPPVGVGP